MKEILWALNTGIVISQRTYRAELDKKKRTRANISLQVGNKQDMQPVIVKNLLQIEPLNNFSVEKIYIYVYE